MKKIMAVLLCLLMLGWIPRQARAEEMTDVQESSGAQGITGCTVTAGDPIKTLAGKTIQVPVSIIANPGFTNFAISLEYDNNQLTLLQIDTDQDGDLLQILPDQEIAQHLGVSTNIAWKLDKTTTCGFVTAASAVPVTGQGRLFTATFKVPEDFSGEATIQPVVRYLRSNGDPAAFPQFVSIPVTAAGTTVEVIGMGDLDASGMVEYDDVMLAHRAAQGLAELTDQQLEIGDMNGDGQLDDSDVAVIYQIYTGGL